MEEGGDGQEAGEAGQVAHQALGLDLFAQVHPGIRFQGLVASLGRPDDGQEAVAHGLVEVEGGAQLGGDEGVHGPVQGATGEQIDPRLPQLPGARPAQHEALPALLDEAMDLVEQAGQALHLVQHHPAVPVDSPQLGGEESGIGQKALVGGLGEQVDHVGVGEGHAQPGALADAAGSHQEEALTGCPEDAGVVHGLSCRHFSQVK